MRRLKRKRRSKIYVISSFTEDYIGGDPAHRRIGGPSLYGGYTLHVLGSDFKIITRPSRSILEEIYREYSFLSERIVYKDLCEKHFVFKHEYTSSRRVSYLLDVGCEIDFSIEDLDRDAWIIASPVYKEISIKLVRSLIEREFAVALDIQGLARVRLENGLVMNRLDPGVLRDLGSLDILHGSLEEFLSLGSSPREVIEEISRKIDPEILIVSLGRGGSYAYIRDRGLYRIYAYKNGVNGDETGCGDILLASIVALYDPVDPLLSIIKASLVAGLRVERGFPFELDKDYLNRSINYIRYEKIS